MRVRDAIGAIASARDIGELAVQLQRIAESYGFAAFNFLDLGAPHLDRPFHIGTVSPGFAADYFGNGLIHVDPCIALARRCNTAFTWGETPVPDYGGSRKSGARRTMESAADNGYVEGLISPIRLADGRARTHSCLVVFFWRDRPGAFQTVAEEARVELNLIMVYWAERALSFISTLHPHHARPTPLPKFSPPPLTDREREVLQWAAMGKTARDTGDIMSVSPETIKVHMRHALQKLDANNKTHGVARALSLGLIDV